MHLPVRPWCFTSENTVHNVTEDVEPLSNQDSDLTVPKGIQFQKHSKANDRSLMGFFLPPVQTETLIVSLFVTDITSG